MTPRHPSSQPRGCPGRGQAHRPRRVGRDHRSERGLPGGGGADDRLWHPCDLQWQSPGHAGLTPEPRPCGLGAPPPPARGSPCEARGQWVLSPLGSPRKDQPLREGLTLPAPPLGTVPSPSRPGQALSAPSPCYRPDKCWPPEGPHLLWGGGGRELSPRGPERPLPACPDQGPRKCTCRTPGPLTHGLPLIPDAQGPTRTVQAAHGVAQSRPQPWSPGWETQPRTLPRPWAHRAFQPPPHLGAVSPPGRPAGAKPDSTSVHRTVRWCVLGGALGQEGAGSDPGWPLFLGIKVTLLTKFCFPLSKAGESGQGPGARPGRWAQGPAGLRRSPSSIPDP